MQIDFTLRELSDLYREENRNVQIPGEGVAPMSQLRQRKWETFSLLIFSNGANRSPIFCGCSLSAKLASSSSSMWHSLFVTPSLSQHIWRDLSCRGYTVQSGFVFKSRVQLQSPRHVCSQVLNKTYREPSQWWRTPMTSQMYILGGYCVSVWCIF